MLKSRNKKIAKLNKILHCHYKSHLSCYREGILKRSTSFNPSEGPSPVLRASSFMDSLAPNAAEHNMDLATFLIYRACHNSFLANYFYWWDNNPQNIFLFSYILALKPFYLLEANKERILSLSLHVAVQWVKFCWKCWASEQNDALCIVLFDLMYNHFFNLCWWHLYFL